MKPGTSAPERVSTLELFFDLVFVFTITQVSTVIVESPDVEGVARAAIQLGVIYWMYDGYAWMTIAAGPDTWQRTLLLLIIEGLDLSDVPAGPCDLICLPIKLAGGDGAPARAFVRPHA